MRLSAIRRSPRTRWTRVAASCRTTKPAAAARHSQGAVPVSGGSNSPIALADLADRRWFRFPEGTDPRWQAYWHGGEPREGPVVRTVQECQQAVLWNGTVGMPLLDHEPVPGLTVVPLVDMAPSRVVVAWSAGDARPLVRGFVRIAVAAYGD